MVQLRVMLWPYIEKQNGNIYIKQVNGFKQQLRQGKNPSNNRKSLPLKLGAPEGSAGGPKSSTGGMNMKSLLAGALRA